MTDAERLLREATSCLVSWLDPTDDDCDKALALIDEISAYFALAELGRRENETAAPQVAPNASGSSEGIGHAHNANEPVVAAATDQETGGMPETDVSEAVEFAIAMLKDIERVCPEVLKHCDIEAAIINELNPALVKARQLTMALKKATEEAAINMENFKVTNQAYVAMDKRRLAAEERLEAAGRQREEFKKDAERYRWLRDEKNLDKAGNVFDDCWGERLDAAIDLAQHSEDKP